MNLNNGCSKSSHNLAIYFDEILIWSNYPMAIIKSLEKIYRLKNVGIPENYLGGNLEFLGDSWKNQGLGVRISYIYKNLYPKLHS
jgi:hypothetical protein